ncbi:hypothetical protein KDAU_34400 [Dictyobacter aurantiacus]|uniref:Uncharacterized protein n=1 Tax=Dictyobacter aurantiacus TaxID=1936993 RepID=A0A401ZGU7_9CHLR|nr:hypothetical protein KDAU_34400 [Dictyobacter aurantiacus]
MTVRNHTHLSDGHDKREYTPLALSQFFTHHEEKIDRSDKRYPRYLWESMSALPPDQQGLRQYFHERSNLVTEYADAISCLDY